MCEFNKYLKMEREKKGISQKDFAIQIGLIPDTYRKYEKGTREPDFDTLIKIAEYYNCSTDYLLGRYSNTTR